MTVTPSIIGDGNVLLDVKVNNDVPNEIGGAIELRQWKLIQNP